MSDIDVGGAVDSLERRVAENVRRLRKERGWTQSELGQRLGTFGFPMQQTTVTKLEAGERPIRLDEVLALARLFDVKVEDLYSPPIHVREDVDVEGLENAERALQARLHEVEADLAARRQAHAAAMDVVRVAKNELVEAERTVALVREGLAAIMNRLEAARGQHR